MKKISNLFCALFIGATLLALLPLASSAQQGRPSLGCVDPVIRTQADDIKKHYEKQGFKVLRDAMISMESQEFFPVIAQLIRGTMYEIVFIANPDANKPRMQVLDGRNTKLDQRLMMRNRDQPNLIIYTFVPEATDNYLFILDQKLKNKSVCGSFFILALESNKQREGIIPYTSY